jgi:hypothetical protein
MESSRWVSAQRVITFLGRWYSKTDAPATAAAAAREAAVVREAAVLEVEEDWEAAGLAAAAGSVAAAENESEIWRKV